MTTLYSFRRCPFAIRARMTLVYSGIEAELREVKLSDMPDAMLALSPKATVPVLVLKDGTVIDESIDVMFWSLSQSDPEQWLDIDADSRCLIERSDDDFKPLLDRYKYADRHPELSPVEHRARAEVFLGELEQLLNQRPFLAANARRLTDVAIFPFIRQFAAVDADWFATCKYSAVRSWLNSMLGCELFKSVMKKTPFWRPNDEPVIL